MLLEKYGDVPIEEARKATTIKNADRWSTICDCKGNIISAVRTDKTDWYLWTIKNLVTDKEYRGKGFGRKVTRKAIEQSEKEGAKAITADITYDNKPSLMIFKKLGFKPVTEFCWGKGKNLLTSFIRCFILRQRIISVQSEASECFFVSQIK
jgi:GNAT superfamily N-acetyltransferase